MSKINLIPEVKQKKQRIQRINTIVSSTATVLGILFATGTLLLLALNGVVSSQIKSTNDKIAKTESSIKTMKDLEDQVVNLEDGLREIKLITEKNKSWTKFFNEIEKATPGDIQFLNFSITGNQISASLKGGDVVSIDRFITSFSNYKVTDGQNLFSDVVVNGYSKKDSGQYLFQAKFNLNEAAIW